MNADWQLKFNLQTEIKTDCERGSVSGYGAGWSRGSGWVYVGVGVSGRSDKSETSTKQTQRQTNEHKHKWIKPNRSILCSANKALHTLSDCLLFYAWHSNCRPYDWLMISLALLFHFKTRTGRTQIETVPKACTAHCPPPLPTASPAFATAHAWHLPLPRALWQINHFHLQQHTVLNIHRTPFSFLSLLLLFLSVSLLLLLLFLPWQINLHSAQLRVVRKKVKNNSRNFNQKSDNKYCWQIAWH